MGIFFIQFITNTKPACKNHKLQCQNRGRKSWKHNSSSQHVALYKVYLIRVQPHRVPCSSEPWFSYNRHPSSSAFSVLGVQASSH